MMNENILLNNIKQILDRVIIEHPKHGSIKVDFIFHDGKFVKIVFDKTEILLLNKDENQGKT